MMLAAGPSKSQRKGWRSAAWQANLMRTARCAASKEVKWLKGPNLEVSDWRKDGLASLGDAGSSLSLLLRLSTDHFPQGFPELVSDWTALQTCAHLLRSSFLAAPRSGLDMDHCRAFALSGGDLSTNRRGRGYRAKTGAGHE